MLKSLPQPREPVRRTRVPTTAAGVEVAIAVVFLSVRALNIVQLGVDAVWGLPLSSRPWLDAACMAAFTATSIVIGVAIIRRASYRDPRLVTLDVTAACAITLLQADFSRSGDRVSSWVGWALPIAISAVGGAGLALRSVAGLATAIAAVSACYLSTTFLPATTASEHLTAIVNTLGLLAFSVVAMIAARFLRRLGRDADAARAAAADAATAAELDRHRLLLHDQETVLRLLSQPSLDPSLSALLQKQAASGASRIRSFLNGETAPNASDGTLAGVVRLATADFTDLPMTVSTDLADDVSLQPAAAQPLEHAIVTLLHNVRRHAAATAVVVHAAGNGDNGWEVSVHDNGCGFDPALTPTGFGLSQQVHAALAPHDIGAKVTAECGDGTLVVLRFPLSESA